MQKSDFKRCHVIGVLSAKGVQGIADLFPTIVDDFSGDLDQPRVEDLAQALIVKADKLVDQQARYQEILDAVGETIGEKALNPEVAIQNICETEPSRK